MITHLIYALLGAITALVTVTVLSSLALRRHKRRNPMLSLPPMPSPMPTLPYGEPVTPAAESMLYKLTEVDGESNHMAPVEVPPCPKCHGSGQELTGFSVNSLGKGELHWSTCMRCHGTGLTAEDDRRVVR